MSLHYDLSLRLGLCLQKHNLSVSTAESCTGGGLAQAITAVAGSSAWFDRGVVTYSNAAKQDLLKVGADTLQQFGAVSSETAKAMAKGLLAQGHAAIAMSITGIAGPSGGTPSHPVGTVWFGIAKKDLLIARRAVFAGGRQHICYLAVEHALNFLIEIVDSCPA